MGQPRPIAGAISAGADEGRRIRGAWRQSEHTGGQLEEIEVNIIFMRRGAWNQLRPADRARCAMHGIIGAIRMGSPCRLRWSSSFGVRRRRSAGNAISESGRQPANLRRLRLALASRGWIHSEEWQWRSEVETCDRHYIVAPSAGARLHPGIDAAFLFINSRSAARFWRVAIPTNTSILTGMRATKHFARATCLCGRRIYSWAYHFWRIRSWARITRRTG